MRRAVAFACALVLAGCAGDSEEPPAWNHDPNDATLGPTAWGEIDESFEQCEAGQSQSPVDISGPVRANLPDLRFDYPAVPLEVENTGHVIEVPMPESSNGTLTIEGTEYRLLQYHFHAPSEHTVGGASYDGEVHLVHESEAGELAVVAVFLEEGAEPMLVESQVLRAPEKAGEEVELGEESSPLELLLVADATTATTPDYVTYSGSLTTPGCAERVRWIVVPEVHGISTAALARLHELIAAFPGYEGYENNNRPTQPLNDRVIRRSTG